MPRSDLAADRREDLELDRGLQCFSALIRVDGLEKQLRRWLLRCWIGHC